MTFTLQNSINFAKTMIEYSPLTAGLGMEPAVTIASMIRNSFLSPPMTWYFNRAEYTFDTVKGTQDYDEAIADLAFVEKVSLQDDQGNIFEIKDVYNNSALAVSSFQQQPSAMSVEKSYYSTGDLTFTFRFLGVPDAVYHVTVVYQKIAPQFGPFFVTAAGNAAGGNTTYTGIFDPLSFQAGAVATISGFTTSANNGSFVVVSCSATSLVVVNAGGVAESATAYAANFSWDPLPDQYSDVYNSLFLAEALASVDDSRAQYYRQRGVAALVSKTTGLTDMQKNAFAQQWLQRGFERQSMAGVTQLGVTSRGI